MHALLESDHAILTYILHFFALCRGPKSGDMAQYSHPKVVWTGTAHHLKQHGQA